jgi:hypothetical protein
VGGVVIKLLGALLLATPFVVFITAHARVEGWRVALAIWGVAVLATVFVVGGVVLLTGGWS